MREAGQRLTSLVSVSASQACGLTALSLAVSISEAMIALFAPPSSLPAKSALDHVGVDLDAAIVEEAAEALPVARAVAHGFCDR
jgi:hypothetical protein